VNPAALRYRSLLEQLDAWTDDARRRHPGVLPCRQGCTACCHGPFDISAADVLLLRESVAALPPERRRLIHAQAIAAARRQQSIEPSWTAPHAVSSLGEARFDHLCEALAREPCPCLVDGTCAVYEGRPLVCRLMGLSLEAADGGVLPNGCPIQSEFPAYAALPPQPFDLGPFEETEQACLEEAGLQLFGTEEGRRYETTIAMALTTPVLP
jgi:Fe-S-cluster containining protein